jgi:antibiotic biosynthesis monooxygenase (ABM) superfamily enzyme
MLEATKKDIDINTPITTIVRHNIRLGAEKNFENWVHEIAEKISVFQGFKGVFTIRSKAERESNEYIVVFQFENMNNLIEWMNSKERNLELKKLSKFSKKEMQLDFHDSIGFWFTGDKVEEKKPPKWKMALLTWVAVFPMVLILLDLFSKLLPSFPLALKVLFVTITLVTLLTWFLLPNLTKIFKKWLF